MSFVRESSSVFTPCRFAPQPVRSVRWRSSVPPFECPEITLVCDSISASKSKCGFQADYDHYTTEGVGCSYGAYGDCYIPDGDDALGKYFLTKTETISGATVGDGCPDAEAGNGSGSITTVEEFDPATCINTVQSCEGTITYEFDDGVGAGLTRDCSGSHNLHGLDCVSAVLAYSDEYTTAALISTAIAALPSYDDDFADECNGAFRDLSEDETSYSIRRFKYKFTFASTTGFHLNWVERFTPEGGGSPTDTGKTELIGSGDTESSVYTRNEPATDGTITIVDVECVPL